MERCISASFSLQKTGSRLEESGSTNYRSLSSDKREREKERERINYKKSINNQNDHSARSYTFLGLIYKFGS